jgi:glycosyltransferase involved in cell wall biosynthesis
MSYPPNVNGVEYLALEILPEVWKEMPDVTLKIVGATPSPKVQKLANKNIEVTGWVDDIREYYKEAKIFVAPMLIGTGLQNKLLEAMAMNLPCITTPLANNALKAKENVGILIGKNKEEFKEHILLLLNNKDKASEVAQNGSEFIKNQYNWETTSIPLIDILKK